MADKAKRPQSAHARTLPPDARSLEQMIRSVHRQILDRGAHLQREWHDTHARRGFQTLLDQRAAAWQRLNELDSHLAEQIRRELDLICSPEPEVA